ncbi:MAG: imidazole glycerol phosphate synthase subunit HisH [Oscillospiraceae bacterium]|nr:imidazole glycerol phosphate synthase subunit HisH [Oscillospiraceae bacterium]
MIAIVDYGVGNLFSLASSFKMIGADVTVTSNKDEIRNCNKIILPGVGAFGDAIEKLRADGLDETIISEAKSGKDIMGICLGMQMLFEKSFEYGEYRGLGLLSGEIVPMEGKIPASLKIPHIGWNALHFKKESRLLKYIKENDCVYFVHSYYAENCRSSLVATAEYGKEITAIVQNGNVFGCQFHPEKSGSVGLNILKAFCEEEK